MNVRTDRKTDRQTDRPHELHVYVGLAHARPNQGEVNTYVANRTYHVYAKASDLFLQSQNSLS